LVLAPRPVDLTPADTSSYLRFDLAAALGARGLRAEPCEIPLDPTSSDVAALRVRAADSAGSGGRTVVVGTIDATIHRGQASLIRALVEDGVRVVAIALRTPFDLAAYPSVGTYACSYGIQPPTSEALADGLVGVRPFVGRLPVRLAVATAVAA
ncbi:MAG TPA: hypothetical protein VFR93_02795, partial [Candidatus Limnocylindrales bacterium]|nr:hypothetical protein [Candidatus Limnocylindrales bacterium]